MTLSTIFYQGKIRAGGFFRDTHHFKNIKFCVIKTNNFVRVGRIELPSHPWQGRVLPLNQHRIETLYMFYGT